MNVIMKFLISTSLIFVTLSISAQESNLVKGSIHNADGSPVPGANVYIYGTIDGSMSDSTGCFAFRTSAVGEVTIKCSFLGTKDYLKKITLPCQCEIKIIMKPEAFNLDEVQIVASNFNFGQTNKVKSVKPLDVVMSGNSCGDIFASLHSLPGVQTVGENGRLYVRGGEDYETQIFINGMHVLQPYDTEPENTVTRSRFSPFLFKGINFSLGGYNSEYGQALSSVLPMETTDVQTHDKFGLNFSPLSMAAGGTKSFGTSSLSFNTEYMDLKWYDKLFPDKYDWNKPFHKVSGEMQYKIEPSSQSSIKTYFGYDHTALDYHIPQTLFNESAHNMGMKENNVYFNSVYRSSMSHGWDLFAGVAWSWLRNVIGGAVVSGDEYVDRKSELHLKTYVQNSFAGKYKLSCGLEDYIRSFHKSSSFDGIRNNLSMDYHSWAVFVDNQIRLMPELYLSASLRMENKVGTSGVYFMPRASFSFIPSKSLQASLLYGRYSQVVGDELNLYGCYIRSQSFANHYVASLQYKFPRTTLRLESYIKNYDHLPLFRDQQVTMDGKGYSRGIDFFLENNSLIDRLTTTLSYSYNYSRRKYLEHTEYVQPQYATEHNSCISLKYSIPQIKSIFGFSENITSGRPYTDPSMPGKLQRLTKPYLSTGINVSYLASPSVIVYASVTNIFNRHNIFNYQYREMHGSTTGYIREPITASRDRFFYVGVFISLTHTHAYEVSNF